MEKAGLPVPSSVSGFTALHVAAYEGDLELVGQLLEAGADQDKATNVSDLQKLDGTIW